MTPSGTVNDGNGGNNYTVTFVNDTTGVINARALTVTAVSDTKAYDGTTSSSGAPTITSGALAAGDSANFTQTFDTQNAGTGKTLTPAGSVTDGNSGNNYSVTLVAVTTGTITQAGQTITVTTHAPAQAQYNKSFTVAATGGSSSQSVAIAGSGACTGSGNDSTTILMTSSTGTCTVTYTQAGNTNYAAATQVIETTAAQAALAVSTLADGSVANNATLNIVGSALVSGGSVTVTVNAAPVTINADGTFSSVMTLTTGTNAITIVATNADGTPTTDTRTITYDNTSPVLAITTPSDNSIINSLVSSITITGTVAAGNTVTVSLNGGAPQFAIMSGGDYAATINRTDLAPGLNTILVTVDDGAGHTTSMKRTVVYSASAPALAVTSPDQDIVSSGTSTVMISGLVSDPSYTVQVTLTGDGTTTTYAPAVNGDGTYSQLVTFGTTTMNLTYTVTVTADDGAGHTSTIQRNIVYKGTPIAAQTITFNALPAHTYGDADFDPAATASSGLAVTYASSNTSVATIVSNKVHILSAGTTTITASQSGDINYSPASDVQQPLMVNNAMPSVTSWPTAGGITYGQALSASTLTNGSATVPGTFVFTTPSTTPPAGTYSASVIFTPIDMTNYNTVTGSVTIDVAKATPSVTSWPAAGGITYGQALSASTLTGGSASIPGTFALTTPSTTPPAGTYSASVTFIPTDTTNYNTVPTSVNVTVTDTAALPDMVVSTLPDGSHTSDATLNVTGMVDDVSNVQGVLVGSDPVTINADGSFSVAVPLIPGDNLVQITIIDKEGKQTTVSRTIILDPNAPVLAVTSPVDGLLTAQNNVTIAGSADPTSSVTVKVNEDAPFTPNGTSDNFSDTVILNSGINTILILATNPTGSTQTAKRTVFYDFRKPGLAVASPDKDMTITDGQMTISGLVSDALTTVTVTISAAGVDYTPTVNVDGSFTQALTFADEGVYPVVMTATDLYGNSASMQRNIRFLRGSIVINKGAAFTTSTAVTLDLGYVSAPTLTMSTMQLLYKNTAWTAPDGLCRQEGHHPSGGRRGEDGLVRFIDKGGAVSAFYADTIILDTKVPLGSIAINNGDAVTTSPTSS